MIVLDEKFQTSSIFISKQKNRKVLFQFSIGSNEKQGNNYFYKVFRDTAKTRVGTLASLEKCPHPSQSQINPKRKLTK